MIVQRENERGGDLQRAARLRFIDEAESVRRIKADSNRGSLLRYQWVTPVMVALDSRNPFARPGCPSSLLIAVRERRPASLSIAAS